MSGTPLVVTTRLELHSPPHFIHTVDGIDLSMDRGEVLGLIGESGSGASAFGRTLLQLYPPTAGRIVFDGQDVTGAQGDDLRTLRRRMQMVFHDPHAAVNRRKTIQQIVVEPLEVHQLGNQALRAARAHELLDLVGLSESFLARYPHEVSRGQLQRAAIARAMALEPEFIVADDPTASLDVTVRAQVINVLADVRAKFNLTLLFISADLGIVSYISTRMAVMYLGRLVEVGSKAEIEQHSLHPYTGALLSAVPRPNPRERRLASAPTGEIPSAFLRPPGCHYHPRCPLAMAVCRLESPVLEVKDSGHWAACHAILPATAGKGPRIHGDAGSATTVALTAGEAVAPGARGGVEMISAP